MFEELSTPGRTPLTYVRAKWLWLRALGLIFFSAFYSLWFQIHGLIGSRGVLPAREYLALARRVVGAKAYWLAPTVLWLNDSDAMLTAIVVAGAIASITLTFNFLPRTSIAVAMVCFLSFIGAAQDFASYQSDGMLLEAAFLSLFLGGKNVPPSWLARFVLVWEWFRIYFESGMVKILSGEQQWRNLTAMDKYYENGPLPTWIGWHAQQLPHSFHAATAAATLLVELFIVWFGLFPSGWSRVTCFVICTLLQIGIIATANYAFLNYLVLALGVWLLDDRVLSRPPHPPSAPSPPLRGGEGRSIVSSREIPQSSTLRPREAGEKVREARMRGRSIVTGVLIAHLITTSVMFFFPGFPLAVALGPTRIVNNFGLFAVMTRARFEIEFQGTRDGQTWIAYPFKYKPQDVKKPPGIYAPYQPRFDWNLWFASLGPPEDNPFVMNTQERLMEGSPQVLELFAGNPFAGKPPVAVRAVLWQYWFTTRAERARTGAWWNRRLVGLYAP